MKLALYDSNYVQCDATGIGVAIAFSLARKISAIPPVAMRTTSWYLPKLRAFAGTTDPLETPAAIRGKYT